MEHILKLDNFILYRYDYSEKEHKEIIDKLSFDKGVKKFLGNLNFAFSRIEERRKRNEFNEVYIAYYNDNPVGYISLTYLDDSYQIASGILPEYRHQSMGSLLLQEFSDKLFEKYSNIRELTLKIDGENKGSIKAATLAGYEQDSYTDYKMHR